MKSKEKFYAVRKGRHTGIFLSWAKCQKETTGFKGAIFKSFPTLEEAKKYLMDAPFSENSIDKNFSMSSGRFIFVDGSYREGKYSWAFVAYQDGIVCHTANGKGTSIEDANLRNVAGEIEAVLHAVKWADAVEWQDFTIIHDYSGLAEWACGRWKTNLPLTQYYAQKMFPYRSRVKFQKVTGHTGVVGNELADRLAKEALNFDDNSGGKR